ncbi:hypothetical protein BD560DRAFT_341203 [Blakeslea trispora]|nr:hypothetical protein BD560DRAFT_341203 [Blakeslea trispora]
MMSHGQLYVAMSRVRKSENLFFFGSELPLRIKRKYGLNLDAIDIVEYAEKRQKKNMKKKMIRVSKRSALKKMHKNKTPRTRTILHKDLSFQNKIECIMKNKKRV